jgi:hypothetical protein
MATDPTWNFQDPASKERVLGVLQGEMNSFFVRGDQELAGRFRDPFFPI